MVSLGCVVCQAKKTKVQRLDDEEANKTKLGPTCGLTVIWSERAHNVERVGENPKPWLLLPKWQIIVIGKVLCCGTFWTPLRVGRVVILCPAFVYIGTI